ncbi:hypothetical protein [Planctobacterium marinum]|uniref:hypothetical protein n=1 Tax=Planctobacterium marinum TaxID=1631968 RepID=UPI001E5756C3|nr:hypothetical protein [Planctobacterium marinum]MCC2605919.1 hypothetical protein [Planctobacterium marinum]
MAEDTESTSTGSGSGSNPANWSIVSNAESRAKSITLSQAKEIPATKEFAINATGNLFVATTLNGGSSEGAAISQEASEAFGQVSVFFAAMTKAMSENNDTLYDIEAIDKVVSRSGLFVKVTESNVQFSSKSWGVTFGSELITALLGFSGGLAAVGNSLMQMLGDIGKKGQDITVAGSSTSTDTKVGTIIFVCEYLLGAVSITPIVLSVDSQQASKVFQAGPCFKAQNKTYSLNIDKTTYLFVPPAFIPEAKNLNEAMDNPDFNELVNTLKQSLTES